MYEFLPALIEVRVYAPIRSSWLCVVNVQLAATDLAYYIHVCNGQCVSFLLASVVPKMRKMKISFDSFLTRWYTRPTQYCQIRFKYWQSSIKEMVSYNNERETKENLPVLRHNAITTINTKLLYHVPTLSPRIFFEFVKKSITPPPPHPPRDHWERVFIASHAIATLRRRIFRKQDLTMRTVFCWFRFRFLWAWYWKYPAVLKRNLSNLLAIRAREHARYFRMVRSFPYSA